MRQRLASWFSQLSVWIAGGRFVSLLFPRGALLARAIQLINEVELVHNGGEARRHQVYAALIKQFPSDTKPSIALAIELAIQER